MITGMCVVHQLDGGIVEVTQADDLIEISQDLLDLAPTAGLTVEGDLVNVGSGQAIYRVLGPSPDHPRVVRAALVSTTLEAST